MGWIMQVSCVLAATLCLFASVLSREVPSAAEAAAVAGAAAHGTAVRVGSEDDSPRGTKRELGEAAYHHGGGGGGGGHHHGHATSYQHFVLHSYHPKKVIYHKKHGHHHDAPPAAPVSGPHHHSPLPSYDEAAPEDESYSQY